MSRGEKPEVGSDATDLGGSFAIVSQNAPVARTNARVHDLQLSQDFRLDIDVPRHPSASCAAEKLPPRTGVGKSKNRPKRSKPGG
jgi:hypothetical protein